VRLAILLVLLAFPASAQVFPWGGGTSGGGSGGGGGLQGGIATVSVDVTVVPNSECIDANVVVPNILDDDYVQVQALCELAPTIFLDGSRVAGEGTVAVRVCNLSSDSSEDPLPCDFQFLYVRASSP